MRTMQRETELHVCAQHLTKTELEAHLSSNPLSTLPFRTNFLKDFFHSFCCSQVALCRFL